jgi:hypothetical protein
MDGAAVFGVVTGSARQPRVAYLATPVPVASIAEQLGDADPTSVVRIGARCEESDCAQFADGRCGLAARVETQLPGVVTVLPRCAIRSRCRWFAEQGGEICRRCPQVVTLARATAQRAAVAAP